MSSGETAVLKDVCLDLKVTPLCGCADLSRRGTRYTERSRNEGPESNSENKKVWQVLNSLENEQEHTTP